MDRTIDVLILRLRRKIEACALEPVHLQTRRGQGYVFVLGLPNGGAHRSAFVCFWRLGFWPVAVLTVAHRRTALSRGNDRLERLHGETLAASTVP